MAASKKPRANEAQQTALLASRVPDELRNAVELRAANTPGGLSAIVREAVAIHVGRPDLAFADKEAA